MTGTSPPDFNRIAPEQPQPPMRSTRKGDIPQNIEARYLIERDRLGRAERFFRDHRVKAPSFRDHGRSLTTDAAYPDAIADMLRIARHRGWSRIRISGDEAFRREAWIQAREAGLQVQGYRPRDRDRAAAGDPVPPILADHLRRRLNQAAVIVEALVTDPAVRRRLIRGAEERATALDNRERRLREKER